MSENNSSLGTNLLIFLAGAAVGAAVVALTTPKTGPQLRHDLGDLGHKLKDRVHRMRHKDEEEAPQPE